MLEELAKLDLLLESRELCEEKMMVRTKIVVELGELAKNEESNGDKNSSLVAKTR